MKWIITLLSLLFLVIISGCANINVSETASPRSVITVAPTTSHLRAFTDTPHPIASSTNDITFAPTLNATEKEAYILAHLKDNGKCDLPCWWGIIPGVTNWGDVNMEYSQRGFGSSQLPDRTTLKFGIGGFDLTSISTYTEIVFAVKQDTVENITISATGALKSLEFQKAWEYYSPDNILLKYGKPSRIKLYVSTYGQTDNAGYQYWLYYDKLGFLITYGGGTKKGESFHICPNFNNLESTDNQISKVQIYLKPSNSDLPLEAVVGNKAMELIGPLLKNFEDVTGKSIDEYYNGFLSDHKNICFETPVSLW